MTTNLSQLMREMTEGYRFKKRMSNPFKHRSCPECGDELLKGEKELCERCKDAEIQEEILTREAINHPIVRIEQ